MKLKLEKSKTVGVITLVLILATASYLLYMNTLETRSVKEELQTYKDKYETTNKELDDLKNQDQVKINLELSEEVENINSTYKSAVSAYEEILDYKTKSDNTDNLDELYAKTLSLLAEENYEEAQKVIDEIKGIIKTEEDKIAQEEAAKVAAETPSAPQSNEPPGSGYSRQTVSTDAGSFLVDIISADIGSTRVIVDTASGGDCGNDCPVLSLSEYISRNGAYAGVNGSYFCPASYPSCAGKTNSFDTLLMNKDKVYFNSDNNVYSNNPAVIFGGSYIRFVGAASQWGRDTGIDSMISNYPLLVSAGNVVFGGDDDPKKGSKGNRSFVADRGSTVYIGVVRSATVAESARVMKALGMDNALNLDNGGSTALWSGGYKVGPGRNLPNAILFVGK